MNCCVYELTKQFRDIFESKYANLFEAQAFFISFYKSGP